MKDEERLELVVRMMDQVQIKVSDAELVLDLKAWLRKLVDYRANPRLTRKREMEEQQQDNGTNVVGISDA